MMKKTLSLLVVIIAASMCVLHPTYATADTFGKTDIGATKLGTSWIYSCKYTCPQDGTLTSISMHFTWGSSSYTFYLGIYSDDNGYPGSLIASSAETQMLDGAQWNTATVPADLTANTVYWLVAHWSDSGAQLAYDPGSINQAYRMPRSYGPLPDTFPSGASGADRAVSIFATYTSGADVQAPTYSNVGTNTTVAGQSCKFYTQWSDNVGLSGFIFGTNITGTWQNTTWTDPWTGSPTSGWSNVVETLNSNVGVRIEYRFWCNDTSNNWKDTGIQYIVTTKEPAAVYSPVKAVVIHSDFSYMYAHEYIGYSDAVVFGVLQGAGIPYDVKPANEMADVEKLKGYSLIVFPHYFAYNLPENLTDAVVTACNDGVGVWTVGWAGLCDEKGQVKSPYFISRVTNIMPFGDATIIPQLVVNDTYLINEYYVPGEIIGVGTMGPQSFSRFGVYDPSRPYHEVVSVHEDGSYMGASIVASTLGSGRTVWCTGDPTVWQAHGTLMRLVRWATKSPVFLELADSPATGVSIQLRADGCGGWPTGGPVIQAYKEFMWKIGNITDARVSLYIVTDEWEGKEECWSVARQYPQNEYGSHSRHHGSLPSASPEEVEDEMNGSKRIIEENLGWEITGFAYPYNSFNKATTAAAATYGYEYVYIGHENNMSVVFPNRIWLLSPPDPETTGLDTPSVFVTTMTDYKLFAERGLDPPAVLQNWKDHFNLAAKQAEVSESNDIMCQLWHIKEMASYGITIYFDFLDWVVNKETPFITAQEMVQSVKELEAVNLKYIKSGNVINVTLDGSLSQAHPLRLFNSSDNILSVTIDGQPWTNFRDKVVLLPSLGPGEHNIELSLGLVPTATIRGTVTDSATGNPIGGVNVTCDGESTLTASDGTYSFTVTLGSYALTFTKTGYATETRTQDCPSEGEYVVDVFLAPLTATIRGTVTDSSTGNPIEGVNVTCEGTSTLTASDGSYSFTVALGSYTLTFEKSGYYTNTTTVDCPTEGTYTVDMSLAPTPPPPQLPVNYELKIEDMDEGNKLYAMHKFYHFTAKAYDNDEDINTIKIAFTDGVTWTNFSFSVPDKTFSRLTGYQIAELNISDCNYEIGGKWVNITFSIRIKYGVDDASNIELYQLSEDSLGNTSGWQTMQTDYASIVKPNVSAPLGSVETPLKMVGTIAGAVILWYLWRRREKTKAQSKD